MERDEGGVRLPGHLCHFHCLSSVLFFRHLHLYLIPSYTILNKDQKPSARLQVPRHLMSLLAAVSTLSSFLIVFSSFAPSTPLVNLPHSLFPAHTFYSWSSRVMSFVIHCSDGLFSAKSHFLQRQCCSLS